MIGQVRRMPYNSFSYSRTALGTRGRFLGSDLAENGAQFVKIHRLGQMKIKTSFFAALNIVRCSKSSERHGFNRSFSFDLGDHVVTAAVRQGDVAKDDIELF